MPKYQRHNTRYPGVYYILGKSVANGKPERVYYVRYYRNGKEISERVGRQYQDAMTPAKASRIRASRINNDSLPNKERRLEKKKHVWTLDALFKDYLDNKTSMKRPEEQVYQFNTYIREYIGNKKPQDITPKDINKIKKNMHDRAPQTVKHILSLVNRLINFGVNHNYCEPLHFKIQYPKFDNRKTEDLTSDQLKHLLDGLDNLDDKDVRDIMLLTLNTGMRKTEMLNLVWNDIDFDRGFITIREPKGVVTQTIPMNHSTRELLENRKKDIQSEYVFPSPKTNGKRDRNAFNRQLRSVCKLAGLPDDFRPLHGLRHVYASMLASSGKVDMYTLQKLLTHKTPQMTQRYAHLRDEALKRAADVADDIIGGIIGDGNEGD